MTELAIPESRSVVTAADFAAAMTDAKAKANTLAQIVEERGLFTMIQGKKYLEVEAWETIGRAYGYTAKTEWSRRVDDGGWEARAVVIDAYGVEVGAAETECGTKGDRPWDTRPSNVQRSMAQTRAVSKALRSVLSWVVVLAGYSPTPANEMPDSATGGPRVDSRVVTENQLKRLWAIAQGKGFDSDTIKNLCQTFYECELRQLTRDQYDDFISRIQNADEPGTDTAQAEDA